MIIELKKRVLLCQHKLHMKPTTSIPWFNNVKCIKFLFSYVLYCNIKEKHHVSRNINSKKRKIYMWNQCYCYSDLPKIRVGRACTTKNLVAFALSSTNRNHPKPRKNHPKLLVPTEPSTHAIAQRATKFYLVFLLLTLNMIS